MELSALEIEEGGLQNSFRAKAKEAGRCGEERRGRERLCVCVLMFWHLDRVVELRTSKVEEGGLRSYFRAKAGEEARKVMKDARGRDCVRVNWSFGVLIEW